MGLSKKTIISSPMIVINNSNERTVLNTKTRPVYNAITTFKKLPDNTRVAR